VWNYYCKLRVTSQLLFHLFLNEFFGSELAVLLMFLHILAGGRAGGREIFKIILRVTSWNRG
jgi:hypothetical protein